MTEKDCVNVYIDVFKWGFLVLSAMIVWLLQSHEAFDFPVPPWSGQWGTSVIFFIIVNSFWLGWGIVLDRIQRHASNTSDHTGFVQNVKLDRAHWGFTFIALVSTWYIVFDCLMISIYSLLGFGASLSGFVIASLPSFAESNRRRARASALPTQVAAD